MTIDLAGRRLAINTDRAGILRVTSRILIETFEVLIVAGCHCGVSFARRSRVQGTCRCSGARGNRRHRQGDESS